MVPSSHRPIARTTAIRRRRRWLSALACSALGALQVACAVDPTPDPAAGAAPFELQVGALTGSCGGAPANPFPTISSFRVIVREPTGDGKMKSLFQRTVPFKSSDKSITVNDIPAGSPREVTLLGFTGGTTPAWFARKSGVNVQKITTTPVDLTLMALEGFTCLSQAAGTLPNTIFPAATRISGGKILITGGFAQASASADGKEVILDLPKDEAYLFDPGTGTFERVQKQMKAGRAGHSAVYLPKLNQVLIVGGAAKMRVPVDGSGPPRWKPEEGVNLGYEIYDIAKNEFIEPSVDARQWARKRVFPNLMVLSDDYVVSVGGAVWPVADDQSYRESDLFDSSKGEFVNTFAGLPTNSVRSGAALAFAGTTDDGTNKYLIWGGNGPKSDPKDPLLGPGPIAEHFKESTQLGEGTFNASLAIQGDYVGTPGALYFPSLTAIGPGRDADGKLLDDGRFLAVGGIRYDVGKKTWAPPSAQDVFLLTLTEATETSAGKIVTKRLSGLESGIYLHQANPAGTGHVVLTGGFSAFGQGAASYSMQAIDVFGTAAVPGPRLLPSAQLPAAAKYVKRGGHVGLTLGNDCVLLHGGVTSFDDLKTTQASATDVYCPGFLEP